ncbi:hypothetical protein SBRY_20649 [Actinacidiphila bryophytorum]|uniref:Uncharacterized protein n=1 Tax=Actinacidiphila bryophytorum TaxID=1436133 RepID=A0A9W4EA02_9ACTN|nr:hypothetical protein SBRY_20649 [Actinacidiphila bryophytorum]
MARRDGLDTGGEVEVLAGQPSAGGVRRDRHGEGVVAEGQVRVVVQLVLDPGDVHGEDRRRQVRKAVRPPQRPPLLHLPPGQLPEPRLDLFRAKRVRVTHVFILPRAHRPATCSDIAPPPPSCPVTQFAATLGGALSRGG